MKKFLALVCICGLIAVTGCTNTGNEKTLICTKKDNMEGAMLESNYSLKSIDGYVTILSTVETVTSENRETLNTYKTTLEDAYKEYNTVEHYKNDVKIEGNKLISTTNVDYSKVDTKKLIEIDENNKAAIENGKIKALVLKEAYEKLGATCKTN